MDGFVDSPPTEAIAKLARDKRVPFVEDLGSGAMIQHGIRPRLGTRADARGSIAKGRGHSLLQWRQTVRRAAGGIIAGKAKLIAALKREPLFRALRCDKLILAALEATADIYLA